MLASNINSVTVECGHVPTTSVDKYQSKISSVVGGGGVDGGVDGHDDCDGDHD